MEAFRRNQAQFHKAMQGAFAGGPFAEIARRNMEMFEAAASAFQPKGKGSEAGLAAEGRAKDDEIASLKAQLAELQTKIDKLS